MKKTNKSNKPTKTIDTNYEDAFIREVDEDLKNESMQLFWKKYGLGITILVTCALTFAVSFEAIKSWHIKRLENWSDTYSYAVSLQQQNKYDQSIVAYDNISSQDYGVFADLAEMQKANILLSQGKMEEAFVQLSKIIEDKDFNPKLKDTARIKLASYKVDTAPANEVANILSSISNNPQNGWYVSACELMALLSLREGNTQEAINFFEKISQDENASMVQKNRIKNIISTINKG